MSYVCAKYDLWQTNWNIPFRQSVCIQVSYSTYLRQHCLYRYKVPSSLASNTLQVLRKRMQAAYNNGSWIVVYMACISVYSSISLPVRAYHLSLRSSYRISQKLHSTSFWLFQVWCIFHFQQMFTRSPLEVAIIKKK